MRKTTIRAAWVTAAILVAALSILLPGWEGRRDRPAPAKKKAAPAARGTPQSALFPDENADFNPDDEPDEMIELAGAEQDDAANNEIRSAAAENPAPTSAVRPKIAEALEWWIKPNGSFEIQLHGVPVVSGDFVFWTGQWKWVQAKRKLEPIENGAGKLEIEVPALSTRISGALSSPRPHVAVADLSVGIDKNLRDVIGGGLEFKLHRDAGPLALLRPAPPRLLPENRGWRWELAPGQAIEVAFEGDPVNAYFERGNQGRVRAFLVNEREEAGTGRRVRMTITLPEGARRKPTVEERYGPVDLAGWQKNLLLPGKSPVDLRFLNHKPGAHGFVRANGDRLEFEDGTPARFWGINVMAYALFAPNEQIEVHARRLAQLGFNLVRLHHHDSTGWVSPTVIEKNSDSSRQLSARGIDRIDYWIKCLSDNGIYVWLDLHSYRRFKPGDRVTEHGEIVTFDELLASKGKPGEVKGFCQYDPVLQKLMAEFQENYLSHVNRYTGKAYKNDPAVVGLLITNENDLTQHFGVTATARSGHAALNRLFEEQVSRFARRTGLDERQLKQPWSPGPAKMFLNDQEFRFYTTMRENLRKIDAKAPVAVGNMWGDNPLSSLPALTSGDLIDVHRYAGSENLSIDPRYEASLGAWIGCTQVLGMPLTVSEWNFVKSRELAVDRFTGPMYVAGLAALQGWDALMHYGYSQQPLKSTPHRAGVWNSLNDPAQMALMPAAALAFRQGHVAPARRTYCLRLTKEQVFGGGLDAETCTAARTLLEQSRFTVGLPAVPELDWLHPTPADPNAVDIANPLQSFLAPDATFVESDTGEIRREWEAGIQTVNTPKSQAAQGHVGGRKIELADVAVEIGTPYAAVAVSALDDQPIRESSRILVSSVARVWKDSSNKRNAAGDVYSEPVRGTLVVRARSGLQVIPLAADGSKRPPVADAWREGAYHIPLDEANTHWHVLEAAPAK